MKISKKKITTSYYLSLGPEHAETQYNIFVGNKSFKLTQASHPSPDYIRQSMRNGMINLGKKAVQESGLNVGDKLNMIEKDGEIVFALMGMDFVALKSSTSLTIDKTEPFIPNAEYVEVPVRGKGFTSQFTLPKELTELAGIENTVAVKVNNNAGLWLEISKLADTSIESRRSIRHRLGNILAKVDGVVYQDTVSGKRRKSMTISNLIVREFDAFDDKFKLWYNSEKNCIVVEAPSQRCDINDEEVRSLPAVAQKLDVCPSCMDEMSAEGMLRELIRVNEQIAEERKKLEALVKAIS